MKKNLLPLLALLTSLTLGQAQTTTFTYQGSLTDSGALANGSYDLQFTLRDALTAGNPVGGPLIVAPVRVIDGRFTITLDFGAVAFPGADRWLELGVRTNGSGIAYTLLSPRQAVTAAPYAIQAASASVAITATHVTGAIADGQLSANIPRLAGSAIFAGTVTATNFSGNGAGLTNVNAAMLGGLTTTNFWQLGGNGDSDPSTNFLGTLDNQRLEFRVNNTRALRLEPTANDASHSNLVNVVGGSPVNFVGAGVYGATIAGGGAARYAAAIALSNSVFADLSTLGGGGANTIQTNSPYSTLGGGFTNTIQANSPYSTIAGGANNTVQSNASFSTVGGGFKNAIQTNAPYSTITGGIGNTIQTNALISTIGGGFGNTIQIDGGSSTIGGGYVNTIQANASSATLSGGIGNTIQAAASYSTLGGGSGNTIQTNATASTLGGGEQNTIQANANNSTLGGGYGNTIENNASHSTFGGGYNNTIQANASSATLGGGALNRIQLNASHSTLGGGYQNIIGTNAAYSTLGGGDSNELLNNAHHSTLGGGEGNIVTGPHGVVPGGRYNQAGSNSFAAGYRAKAVHAGAFVWADSQQYDFLSTTNNEFRVRANGGVVLAGGGDAGHPQLRLEQTAGDSCRLQMDTDISFWQFAADRDGKLRFNNGSDQMVLDGGGNLTIRGAYSSGSDRNIKTNFSAVEARAVLAKVVALPIQRWAYKQDAATPHIGPMAQDFFAAFGVGADDKHIATVDADGVALAAIQGLNQIVQEKGARISRLETELSELQALVKKLAEQVKGVAR